MNNLEVVTGKVFDVIGVADAVIAEMSEKYLPLKINGIEDKKGFKLVHDAKMVVKGKRIDVEKKRKELKEGALRYGQAIDKEANRIKGLMAPIEEHLTAEEKAVEDALEAIKQEKARQEEIRIQARRDKLAALGVGFNGQMWTFGSLNLPEAMMKVASDEQFEQLYGKFLEATEAEKRRLEAERVKREEEDTRLAKIAAEQEAERQRLAEEERKARIQKALEESERKVKEDELKAEQKRIADEKAEWERIKKEEEQAIAAAKQKAIDDARHAEDLKKAREEAAERAKKEAEEKIKREVEEKRQAEERAKIAAEKKAARAPDKVKLLAYADALAEVPCPELKTAEGKDILIEATILLVRIITTLREKADAL